ncbi:MAG TPA: tetratricopeptide repeat protein [Noviherbaspirillum sp.]|nr:tetratricopeptide repeat protein [Noviherbaspirillum sp.]
MVSVADSRFANLRSLLIEDLPAMRQSMRIQLGQLEISRVDQATTPDDAIRLVRENSYDLIVCDYNLEKETNGQQLLEFFRSQELLPQSAMFIMVTAESSYGLVAAAAEFQPDAYLLKPLTATKLQERIVRLLDKQAALSQITDRMQQKDFAGAAAVCDRVLAIYPKWITDILKLKGRLLLDIGNIEEARAVYMQALGLRDDLIWAHIGLAKCDIAAGRLQEAKATVQAVLERNAQYIPAYDLLAQIAQAQGSDAEVLDALARSSEVIPSARRSRMVGDVAYRLGDLEQAKAAFDKVVKHTKGSLTAQPSDLLTLAQVHVDSGDAEAALKMLADAPRSFASSSGFGATQAAVQAQAHVKLGNHAAADKAFVMAKNLAQGVKADASAMALAKAAFSIGLDLEGAEILSQAVKSDHENKALVSLAHKVLKDTGNESMAKSVIEKAVNHSMSIVAEAEALMRSARPDESLAKLEEALQSMPDNTGMLLAAAQLHLLWMSQKGLHRDYVARVNSYLAKLDELMPGNERVAKMYRFLRETLVNIASKKN